MFSFSASAALPVDPDTGGSGDFNWTDGIGSSVFWEEVFSGLGNGEDKLSITVAKDSKAKLSVLDCCFVGDAFALIFDDVLVPWDNEGFTGPDGLFEADKVLELSAGMHTIDLTVTEKTPDFDTGAGSWELSAARAVPLPGALGLVGLGLIGCAGSIRRRA